MRVIKFRAWTGKEYRYPPELGDWDFEDCELFTGYNGKPTILEQFTGLLDKNGREIYEGDVLRFLESHEVGCDCEHCFPCRVGDLVRVAWSEDEARYRIWPVDWEEKDGYCSICSSLGGLISENHEITIGCYAVVIGNVHENPELLTR